MHQILFRIPIRVFDWLPTWLPDSIPIFGYGSMLFCAFIATTWLASRLAAREGIDKTHIQDLAIWIFTSGIIGARIVFMIQYKVPIQHFFEIWNGGLVFYGSFIGGVIGYAAAHIFIIRKHGLAIGKMIDIIAPCVAIGLCLGRIGCLLNGCCYGNVACSHCPAIHFPMSSPPRFTLVEAGLQTAAGFTIQDNNQGPPVVTAVEPQSPAIASGLQSGDMIVGVNGTSIASFADLYNAMVSDWPRGQTKLQLSVRRPGNPAAVQLPTFAPRTLGLHPTQIYESISTFLLMWLLLAYFPFRKHDGEVMALFLIGYAMHRFLNEMLRNDTDPVAFGMTLSQNISIVFLLTGIGMFVWLRRGTLKREPQAVTNLRHASVP